MVDQKLLVVSNRSCHSNCSNEDLFGPGFNQAGPCELRVAQADFDERTKRWCLDLLPENRSDPDDVCHSSRALFANLVKDINAGAESAEPWVLFVPGYCSPCLEGLEKARQLQVCHGVNVILFSWPSDPREQVVDARNAYRRTQEAAALLRWPWIVCSPVWGASLLAPPGKPADQEDSSSVFWPIALVIT
jgi:hypothetical protein